MDRIEILGVLFDNVTQDEALQRMDAMIQSGKPHLVITPAILQVMTARRDPEYDRIMRAGDLIVADGMQVVFASHLHKTPLKERVTGVDLVPEMCRMASEKGYSVFFFGAEEGIAQETAEILQQQFPKLKIAGTYSPPYKFEDDPDEEAKAIEAITSAKPDMLIVAMSCPRQDKWLHKRKKELGVPVMIGVGGTFNFITGREVRAPKWMQAIGLEAAFRFVQRPREIWRRVAINAPYFFVLLFDLFTYRTQKVIARWLRPCILAVVDAVLASLMFLFSCWLYFRSGIFDNAADPFPDYPSLFDMPVYSDLPLFLSILAVVAVWSQNLYQREKYVSLIALINQTVKASILAVFLLITFQFVFKDLFMADRFLGFSRGVFAFYMVTFFGALTGWRLFFSGFEHFLHRIGINLDRIIVVGNNPIAHQLIQTMLERPELGNFPLGYVVNHDEMDNSNEKLPVLGTIDDLQRLLPARKVDEVLIADQDLPKDQIRHIVQLCRQHRITLSIVPTIHELLGISSEIKQVGNTHVITVSLDEEKQALLKDETKS